RPGAPEMAAGIAPVPVAPCADSAATLNAARAPRATPLFDRVPRPPCGAVCRGEIRCLLLFFRPCPSALHREPRFLLPIPTASRQSASDGAQTLQLTIRAELASLFCAAIPATRPKPPRRSGHTFPTVCWLWRPPA